MRPRFFASPAEMRAWLEEHHATSEELLVGYHKKHTGKPSLTWSESVDEALCFGWCGFASLRRRAPELRFAALLTTGGAAARAPLRGAVLPLYDPHFSIRTSSSTLTWSGPSARTRRRGRTGSRARRATASSSTFYVASAKRPETRARRLARLVAACARGERLGPG